MKSFAMKVNFNINNYLTKINNNEEKKHFHYCPIYNGNRDDCIMQT